MYTSTKCIAACYIHIYELVSFYTRQGNKARSYTKELVRKKFLVITPR